MPIYEFKCDECNNSFEINESIKDYDSNKYKCTECGSKVKRIYNPVAISFKGEGFYVNDYKRTE